jgi:hypothetical protein
MIRMNFNAKINITFPSNTINDKNFVHTVRNIKKMLKNNTGFDIPVVGEYVDLEGDKIGRRKYNKTCKPIIW